MDRTNESPEDLARLPLEDRAPALAELVEALEKRLEATGQDETVMDAQDQTSRHRDSSPP